MPFLLAEMRFDRKAVFAQRVRDLVLPPLDDAGGEKDPARLQIRAHDGGQRDDDVGDDVRRHDVVARAEACAHARVGEYVARIDPEAVRADAVQGGVRLRDLGRFRVDVAADGALAAEQERPAANFCTKCGSRLVEDARFCTRCGATVE